MQEPRNTANNVIIVANVGKVSAKSTENWADQWFSSVLMYKISEHANVWRNLVLRERVAINITDLPVRQHPQKRMDRGLSRWRNKPSRMLRTLEFQPVMQQNITNYSDAGVLIERHGTVVHQPLCRDALSRDVLLGDRVQNLSWRTRLTTSTEHFA